jgi:hypothetical protein
MATKTQRQKGKKTQKKNLRKSKRVNISVDPLYLLTH